MNIDALNDRPHIPGNDRLNKAYVQLLALLDEIRKRELTDAIIGSINDSIARLNAVPDNDKSMAKMIRRTQSDIIKVLEKELKIVPKNYYTNLWTALGMTVFGLPIGVAIGVALKKTGLLGIGLPIGMAIGRAVGINLDKKALKEGRQLDIELKP